MTEDMIAFIRAQLDEDERVAREAGPGPWLAITTNDFISGPDSALDLGGPDGRVVLAGWFEDDPIRPTESEHMARWDPARVLAEVEAKRRILDDLVQLDGDPVHGLTVTRMFRTLALPYADRDGYREEWRP